MQTRRFCFGLMSVCIAIVLLAPAAHAAEFRGTVNFGSVPVPGATVTLTQGSKSLTTVTDPAGFYYFADVPNGTWKLSVRLLGFAPLDSTVTVPPAVPSASSELSMLPLDEILVQAKTIEATPPAALEPRPVKAADKGKSLADLNAETQRRAQGSPEADDGLVINGNQSNAATSKYTLDPAFGNHRAGSKALYNGGVGVHEENSVFDARPYSLTGLPTPKDEYNRFTGVVTLGGPVRIPHLVRFGPTFSLAYEWVRNSDQATLSGLVPTAAERSGDLAGLLTPQGQPLSIFNPATNQPFTGPIPVSPQAQALLALYPLPNLAGNASYNYQNAVLNRTHADALQSRMEKSIGRRDQIYGSFAFQSVRSNNTNLFDFLDTTNTLGMDSNVHWSHLWHHEFLVDLGYEFSRERTEIRPAFDDRQNISALAGVHGNDQDSADWGPPTLAFSSGIASLTDSVRTFDRNRTDGLSNSTSWNHRAHNITFGGDLRRQEFNVLSQQNPRGTFTFTGAATSGTANAGTANAGSPTETSGSDLADFLLGVPDTGAIAFGNADKYFRQTVYDLFATDDWRIRPELTINAGMRWEYGAPLSELYGRLVNLDVASGFSAIAPVLASAPVGSLTGTAYPASLIRPDKHGFEPRIGLSWRPIPASTLVVRAGYGIYDDTSIYLSSAQQMAQQAPLSTSLSVANSAACPLTLANGFAPCGAATVDPFGVNRNLRVGYAQVWQISAQRDLPGALVLIATYLGTKGTHGEQEFLPNTYPIGATDPTPQAPAGFLYRTSGGNSTRNAGTLQLRRRLRSGITATIQYTFSKSIDDDSELGGQGHVTTTALGETPPVATPTIAQDWLDLRGERSLSTFDQRHLLTVNMQYSSGVGLHGGTLLGGWRGTLLKDWTITNQFTLGTGLPETPVYLAAVPGTGVTGTIRPDLTGSLIYGGTHKYFLNAGAYTAPAGGRWGDAGRDSITGPGQLALNTSLARTIRLRDPMNLDLRIDATNLLNHVNFTTWNTTVNSTTFGLPTSANALRSLQTTLRLRF